MYSSGEVNTDTREADGARRSGEMVDEKQSITKA